MTPRSPPPPRPAPLGVAGSRCSTRSSPPNPTPTTANHLGVNPICTHDPVCPFHSVSLDQAIGGTRPIALLVSTPAFCQVAICGPVLDLFIKRKATFAAQGITVIHAEVY